MTEAAKPFSGLKYQQTMNFQDMVAKHLDRISDAISSGHNIDNIMRLVISYKIFLHPYIDEKFSEEWKLIDAELDAKIKALKGQKLYRHLEDEESKPILWDIAMIRLSALQDLAKRNNLLFDEV